jgi:hypothetical protein
VEWYRSMYPLIHRMVTPIVAILVLAIAAAGVHAEPRGQRAPRGRLSTPEAPSNAVGVGRPDPSVCRPRRETLGYHGGDLVANPDVFILFWGPQWNSDPEQLAAKADLVGFYTNIGASEFACAWREYAVPGHPLNNGTFNGSFVITSVPPNPLSDATIRSEIQHQITLGNAPSRTDDRVYVVVPQKGVPVVAGLASGCGGFNFVFCGYHDSFGTLAARFRYAVLPYPCNQGGFTCFVEPTENPGLAFEAVGSHELTELVTDPDGATLGGSGWFSDRTGNENADICASDACADQLTVGANTYMVNPGWSNLAKGCVTSVPCSVAPECDDGTPGLCTPGHNRVSNCAFEWQVNPNLTIKKGFPTGSVSCHDGQPFCDFDAAANGSCTFHVAACLNSADPRVSCTHIPVDSIVLSKPKTTSSDPVDITNAGTILTALQNVDAGSTGAISDGTVTYSPAAATVDSCTSFISLVVPTGMKRSFNLKLHSSAGSISGRLRLACNP